MTVGKKIAAMSMTLVAFTAALGGVALFSISNMNASLEKFGTDIVPGLAQSAKIDGSLKDVRARILNHIAESSQEAKQSLEVEIAEYQRNYEEASRAYEAAITTEEERRIFAQLGPAYQNWMVAWEKMRSLSRAGKSAEALHISKTNGRQAFFAVNRVVQAMREFNMKSASTETAASAKAASSARVWTGVMVGFALLTAIGISVWVIRSIASVLGEVCRKVTASSEQVASASAQVASASQSLAQGASEQAASIEETSAAAEELNSMTRRNSEDVDAAAELVAMVDRNVTETNHSIEQMVTAMSDITASSDKVARIIKVIDEIAFQTNILALNAAVEAARAGEAGLGFAVVADEVRNLAQRCAQAARDTSELIESSINSSRDGKSRLELVTHAVQSITDSAGKMKTIVSQVAASTNEQRTGVERIAQSMTQMEQVTQTAAATAEETASSSEELNAMSESMKSAVNELQAIIGHTA